MDFYNAFFGSLKFPGMRFCGCSPPKAPIRTAGTSMLPSPRSYIERVVEARARDEPPIPPWGLAYKSVTSPPPRPPRGRRVGAPPGLRVEGGGLCPPSPSSWEHHPSRRPSFTGRQPGLRCARKPKGGRGVPSCQMVLTESDGRPRYPMFGATRQCLYPPICCPKCEVLRLCALGASPVGLGHPVGPGPRRGGGVVPPHPSVLPWQPMGWDGHQQGSGTFLQIINPFVFNCARYYFSSEFTSPRIYTPRCSPTKGGQSGWVPLTDRAQDPPAPKSPPSQTPPL